MASYESSVEPIKVGYLADMTVSNPAWRDAVQRLVGLVFKEGHERGMLDRPVELVYREVEGLPKGSVKAAVDGNPVGQAFVDRFEKAHGRRVESFSAVARHDLANVLLHALADAQPLSPLGVKEALERIKLLPAACGAPGMCISFCKWMRRGWTNVEYIVAREVQPDGKTHNLVDRHVFE